MFSTLAGLDEKSFLQKSRQGSPQGGLRTPPSHFHEGEVAVEIAVVRITIKLNRDVQQQFDLCGSERRVFRALQHRLG